MRKLIIALLTITYCCISLKGLYAQDDCSDEEFEDKLEVTKMVFNANRDTIFITIKNNCNDCGENVYTGVIVYRGQLFNISEVEDTLAIDILYTSEWTPENNSERTYTAIVKKDFGLNEEFKVGLVGVCSKLPMSPDVVLNLNEESILDKKKVIIKNNRLLIPDPDQTIKHVSIYNLSGQLALKETAVNTSFYDLKIAEPGLYLVSVTLYSGEKVNLKYVNY